MTRRARACWRGVASQVASKLELWGQALEAHAQASGAPLLSAFLSFRLAALLAARQHHQQQGGGGGSHVQLTNADSHRLLACGNGSGSASTRRSPLLATSLDVEDLAAALSEGLVHDDGDIEDGGDGAKRLGGDEGGAAAAAAAFQGRRAAQRPPEALAGSVAVGKSGAASLRGDGGGAGGVRWAAEEGAAGGAATAAAAVEEAPSVGLRRRAAAAGGGADGGQPASAGDVAAAATSERPARPQGLPTWSAGISSAWAAASQVRLLALA